LAGTGADISEIHNEHLVAPCAVDTAFTLWAKGGAEIGCGTCPGLLRRAGSGGCGLGVWGRLRWLTCYYKRPVGICLEGSCSALQVTVQGESERCPVAIGVERDQ
jgi:hypothetical protein